jgi:hypothetical protein
MKTVYLTRKQINEISSWAQNVPIAQGGGSNKVSLQGYFGHDGSYDCGKPITDDEISNSLTADFFKEFGMAQGREYHPFAMPDIEDYMWAPDGQEEDEFDEHEDEGNDDGVNWIDQYHARMVAEEYNQTFLDKKFTAPPTAKEKMTIQNTNGFVDNYMNGETSLKALRQKVYNMEHGKSAEDPETQKQIVNAYNNAKKGNAAVQGAKERTKNAIAAANDNSKDKKSNKPIITYF